MCSISRCAEHVHIIQTVSTAGLDERRKYTSMADSWNNKSILVGCFHLKSPCLKRHLTVDRHVLSLLKDYRPCPVKVAVVDVPAVPTHVQHPPVEWECSTSAACDFELCVRTGLCLQLSTFGLLCLLLVVLANMFYANKDAFAHCSS